MRKKKVVIRRNKWNQKLENVQTSWTLETTMTYFPHSLSERSLAWRTGSSPFCLCLQCLAPASFHLSLSCRHKERHVSVEWWGQTRFPSLRAAPNCYERTLLVFLSWMSLPRALRLGLERKCLYPIHWIQSHGEGRVSAPCPWSSSDTQPLACP